MSDPREIRWGGCFFDAVAVTPHDGQERQVSTIEGPATLIYCGCCKGWRAATQYDSNRLSAQVGAWLKP